ncbi:alpha/beta hydrolase [Lentibacillus sp. N15]|uniref:alpha/beta fold hydrolase n=1 Tax=Lentibacillus songyuanensis TaxID=3136161 RepID=UPI0031BA68D9
MKNTFKHTEPLEERKTTVLFLPGNMCAPDVFSQIELPDSIQSSVIDWANSKGPWDITSLGKRINQFILEENLGDTYLAGYSAGGAMALASATEDNAQAKGLLISNTGANTKNHGDPHFPKKIKEQWGTDTFIESFLNRCFSKPIDKELKPKLISYIKHLNEEAVLEAAVSIRKLDLKPMLPKINCKTTIAHGKDDISRNVFHAKELQENIKGAKLSLLKGGHTIMVENREEWQKELWELIQE